VIVQILMAGRVIYGMAQDGELPGGLAHLSARPATPVRATLICAGATLVLALLFPIIQLAELTSGITLAVFALVCLALARIRSRGTPAPEGTFLVYRWVPMAGALACIGLLLAGVFAEV
ncbi:MAG: amino acid permease, partial [Paracoccaceae bacterium]|nr:amino acid permease [Paracoccaceae bacterium]